ncbi:MAG TPA: hypothetical protein VGC76_01985 [Pyrinomonadaceae bacterium]|jgi:hypothetical protein
MKNSLNLVLVILVFIVLGCNCQKFQEIAKEAENASKTKTNTTTTNTSTTSSPSNSSSSTAKGDLTLDKYNQIKNGMTHKEVIDILGVDGVEQMSSGEGKYKVESYKWEGDNYAFISVVFMGDKVNSKVQYGMK